MTAPERLEALERRLSQLEETVAGLARAIEGAAPRAAPIGSRKSEIGNRVVSGPAIDRPGGSTSESADLLTPAFDSPTSSSDHHLEQWLGQRGLLAVGVTALVLAVAYFLRLAFDRGWISPMLRCVGGTGLGAVVGALGWRFERRGLRRYGAGVMGAGAAIIYLAVWAAARLYGLVPPFTGLAGLALVSVALAVIAYAIDIEALGATAVLGAFLAPVVIGSDDASPTALLIYVGAMAAGLGGVASLRRWRLTTALVAVSFLFYGAGAAVGAAPRLRWVYALAGGTGGLWIGLRERWPETRLLAFAGGWGLLSAVEPRLHAPIAIFLGGILLAAPIWWRGWTLPAVWPMGDQTERGTRSLTLSESFYFYLTAIFVGWALYRLSPASFDAHPGLDAGLVGLGYLAAGVLGTRAPFSLVGTGAVLVGALVEWPGLEAVFAAAALGGFWLVVEPSRPGSRGRWLALPPFGAGLVRLIDLTPGPELQTSAPFIGGWALALWAMTAFAAWLAFTWRHATAKEAPARTTLIQRGTWLAAGLLVFGGVTHELRAAAYATLGPGKPAELAAGLSVSAWWILFAAGLVLAGFRFVQKPVRVAGLAVAGLAAMKVLLVDLSELDALYRVGSILILGVVSLALAYFYNARAKEAE